MYCVEEIQASIIAYLAFCASLICAIIAHEFSHLISASLIMVGAYNPGARLRPGSNVFTRANLMANISLLDLVKCFICPPLLPGMFDTSFQPRVSFSAPSSRNKKRDYAIIELTGLCTSVALALIACIFATLPVALACVSVALLAIVSDSAALQSGTFNKSSAAPWMRPTWTFCCGNFGLIMACSEKDSKLNVQAVLKEMTRICMARGAQSGGIAAIMSSPTNNNVVYYRSRVAASKRDNLSLLLSSDLKKQAIKSKYIHRASIDPSNMSMGLFIGHTRFATTSIPLAHETHPHQWSPPSSLTCTYWKGNTSVPGTQPSTFITHNGDFEMYRMFGVDRTFSQIQQWLVAVLDRPLSASCDSIGVAGMMEFLRTQGLWPQSLRRAYQETIAETFDEATFYTSSSISKGDVSKKPPTWKELHEVGELLSKTYASYIAGGGSADNSTGKSDKEESVDDALVDMLETALKPLGNRIPFIKRVNDSNKMSIFLRATIESFYCNDLYSSVQTFFSNAHGSFGMCVATNLDPDRAVFAALNQTMSLSFEPDSRSVLYSSESQVAMVNVCDASGQTNTTVDTTNNWRTGHPAYRIDLNSGDGEICQLVFKPATATGFDTVTALNENSWNPVSVTDTDYCRMELYNMKKKKFFTRDDMMSTGRIVSLVDNPFVDFQPPQLTAGSSNGRKQDLVAQDLGSIPSLLDKIHESFLDPGQLNCSTIEAFVEMFMGVLRKYGTPAGINNLSRARSSSTKSITSEELGTSSDQAQPFDLIVTGVEVSLWAAEQFASDLQIMFPKLKVAAISSNKLIAVVGNARGSVAPTGFSFTLKGGTISPGHTIALAISHSGQTFPTMHATRILETSMPGRVFVLSGSMDTQMALVVGHRMSEDAPFCNRMFTTYAGWRAAEPPSVTVAAVHHALTEILIFCADTCCSQGMQEYVSLSKPEIKEFNHVLHDFSTKGVINILGVDQAGNQVESETHKELQHMGDRWSLHISEGFYAWIMAAAYIIGTVVSGYPLFSGIGHAAGAGTDLIYVLKTLDAFLYIWIWHLSCLFLRLITGRDLWARFGKRTIVVADVPYVNQVLEAYVSKLFALSYGIAAVDVHGTNPADHFVHRFTHRVARGLLIAAGRPDGRLCSQIAPESSVLLALTQAHMIRHLSSPPEVVCVQHNPYFSSAAQQFGIVLPSNRAKFMCEALIDAEDPTLLEPSQRMARMAAMMHDIDGCFKACCSGDQRATVDQKVIDTVDSWIDQDKDESTYVVGVDSLHPKHVECLANTAGQRLGNPLAYISQLGRDAGLIVHETIAGGSNGAETGETIETVQDMLVDQSQLEQLLESRCLSLERLLAFEVIFHRMAQRVANLWPLQFDMSRTQSVLRVCTTAGPVSAAQLGHEYEKMVDYTARSKTFRRNRTKSMASQESKHRSLTSSFLSSRSSRK